MFISSSQVLRTKKKKILGTHKKSNLWASDSELRYYTTWITATLQWARPLLSPFLTHVLHSAMISNIERVMCLEILARCRKRISKMVNFELSLERENDVFRLITSIGNFWDPMRNRTSDQTFFRLVRPDQTFSRRVRPFVTIVKRFSL